MLRIVNLVREYGSGDQAVRAVNGIDLSFAAGEFAAIVGRSGSGKSTLLNLIAGIDRATSGEIWLEDREIGALSDDELTRLRRDRMGIVYQFFNLLPTLSVWENAALPALLAGVARETAMKQARRLLEGVGMGHRMDARPATLSGGEMQRAAIARALVRAPALVLADEPTGNLDSRNAADVLALLRRAAEHHGATLLLVTHSAEAAAPAPRRIELVDGRVAADVRQECPLS